MKCIFRLSKFSVSKKLTKYDRIIEKKRYFASISRLKPYGALSKKAPKIKSVKHRA